MQTLIFPEKPRLASAATVAGPWEGAGPLGESFDVVKDHQQGEHKSWEASERAMMKEAVNLAIEKARCSVDSVDFMLAGDLLNQIISANFAARDLGIPLLGVYSACASFVESLGLGAALVAGAYANRVVATVSSHYGTSERQYRFPTEYGGQRPAYAQHTVTGSGAALVTKSESAPGAPAITHFTVGRVLDLGIKDPYDMGSAMAPAAADTLLRHLLDTGRTPDDYDLILTGDLASVGKKVLIELCDLGGVDLQEIYDDCGCLIFDREKQPVFAGGSGCACVTLVTLAHVLPLLAKKKLRRVLIIATGALLSPLTFQQGETIPAIAHGIVLEQGDGTRSF